MNDCTNCLFYVDKLNDVVVCIASKRIKAYANKIKNCKKWVEDTQENAEKELKKIKREFYEQMEEIQG